jgi:hypothetical protein
MALRAAKRQHAFGERPVDDANAAFLNAVRLSMRAHKKGENSLRHTVLMNRAALAEANDLIARFGEHAQLEAASRANKSRTLGNLIHFCHWRQTERTIEMLSARDATGSIH